MSEITSLIKTLQKDNKDRAKLDTQRTEDIRAMREAQIGDVGNKGAEIEATKEATANSKKTTNLLKTMSGSLTGILGATKKLGAAAKSSFFGALKGLAFGAFLLAVGNFLDSPTFKKLTKKIGEMAQKFADIYKVFSEEGFAAGMALLKENIGLVGGSLLALAALFAPRLLFKGLMFGGKLIFKGGFLILRTLFRAALGKALFGSAGRRGAGGVFTRLMGAIVNMGQGLGNLVSKAVRTGLLAGSKVVGSIRNAFSGFFATGGPLGRFFSRLGFMARTMGTAVSSAIRTGLLAGSNAIGSIRNAFSNFFTKGGPLSRFFSRLGFMARTMGTAVSGAIRTGLLAGSNAVGSIRNAFSNFLAKGGPLGRFAARLGFMLKSMGTSVSIAIRTGFLAGSNAIGSIRGAFQGFFAKGGPLGKFAGRLGFMFRSMGTAVSNAIRTGFLAGANVIGSIRAGFAGFFAKGGPLGKFAERFVSIGASMLNKIKNSLFFNLDPRKLGSIFGKFGKLFTPLATFGSKLVSVSAAMGTSITNSKLFTGIANKFGLLFNVLSQFGNKLSGLYSTAIRSMRGALLAAVNALPAPVKALLPKAFKTVADLAGAAAKSSAPIFDRGLKALKQSGVASSIKPVVTAITRPLVDRGLQLAQNRLTNSSTVQAIAKPVAKLSQTALNALRGTGQISGQGISGVGQSFINRFPRLKLAMRIPIIGPLLTGVFGAQILNDPILNDTEKKKALGKLIGGQIGAAGFAGIGFALGAPAAGVGGFFSGAAMGLGGYFAGEWLGGKMMDYILGDNSVGNAADQAFLAKRMQTMKSRPMLFTPAMQSSFYDPNSMGPKIFKAYEERDMLLGEVNKGRISMADAQVALDDFNMRRDPTNQLGFSIPMVAPAAGNGIIIQDNTKNSNTTVSNEMLGVGDQQFSTGVP
jgi:hypothetical protein